MILPIKQVGNTAPAPVVKMCVGLSFIRMYNDLHILKRKMNINFQLRLSC